MSIEKVKSTVNKKGKRIRGHLRRKKRRNTLSTAKDYAASAILATAAYETFGKPGVRLVRTGQRQLAKKGIKITSGISKKIPLAAKFLPAGLVTAYATKQGMKAIGWSVSRRKKVDREKLKRKYKVII